MRVLLIGPYPPPFGGLSVQVQDWQRWLTRNAGYECAVLNVGENHAKSLDGCVPVTGRLDFLSKLFRFVRQGYVLHVVTTGHSLTSWLSCFLCVVAGAFRRRQTLLVFGSGHAADYIRQARPTERTLIRNTIRLAGRLVCRNEGMRNALIGIGAEPKKIDIVPGFLGLSSVADIVIPESICVFLDKHSPLLGVTATVSRSGCIEPEYGIPMTLQVLKDLKDIHPRIGLVVIGPERQGGCGDFESVRDHVLLTGPLSHDIAVKVISKLTVFLRPTQFDGDSTSVREAMSLGVPVVASDTGYRPQGVLKFLRGDAHDLRLKLEHTLAHLNEITAGSHAWERRESAALLMNIYAQLLARGRGA